MAYPSPDRIGSYLVDEGHGVCFYVFMRTTIELPPELFRRAKARAVERGETLKTLLTRAVAAELGHAHSRPTARARVGLPLFGNPEGPTVHVRAADLERELAREDVLHVGRQRRRRRR